MEKGKFLFEIVNFCQILYEMVIGGNTQKLGNAPTGEPPHLGWGRDPCPRAGGGETFDSDT